MLPDSAGNTVVLLTQISQQLSNLPNGTQAAAIQLPLHPQPIFQPPASAVCINALWFTSLVISLFCALLATLQQHWARRYLRLTQPQCAIHKRALIHAFLSQGATRFHLTLAVDAIPALLHVSVFLFLAGLVISLFNIQHIIAYIVLTATILCAIVYITITVMPVIYPDSPYHSPFSALVWYAPRKAATALLSVILHLVVFLQKFTYLVPETTALSLPKTITQTKNRLSQNMTKAAHNMALSQPVSMVAQALAWTLDRLDEEGELEQFAAGIPGFCRSLEVLNPMQALEKAAKLSQLHRDRMLYRHIMSLLIRASEPGLLPDSKQLPDSVREHRRAICLKALYFLPHGIESILKRVAEVADDNDKKTKAGFASILETKSSWLLAERLSKRKKESRRDPDSVTVGAQCMATVMATLVTRPPNEETRRILMRQLKIDEQTLDRYLESFDSLLLKNLNHFLEDTALKSIIKDAGVNINVILWTVCLAKRFQLAQADEVLRKDFEKLRAHIESLVAPAQTRTVRENATKLLEKLSSLTPANPPLALGSVPRTGPLGSSTVLSGRTGTTTWTPPLSPSPQLSSPEPLPLASPRFNGTYLPMSSPPLHPSTPYFESHPLVPVTSNPSYRGRWPRVTGLRSWFTSR